MRTTKMNMTRERYKDKWWGCEYEDPIERKDRPRGESKANRRRPKPKQLELELEYSLDEI